MYFGLAGLAFALREVGDMLGDRQAAQATVSALGRDPGYAIAWPDHRPAIPAVTSRPA